jgi:hypothetical protein
MTRQRGGVTRRLEAKNKNRFGRPYGVEGQLPWGVIPRFRPGLFSDAPRGLGSVSFAVSSESLRGFRAGYCFGLEVCAVSAATV